MGFIGNSYDEPWDGAEGERESNKNLEIIHVIFKAVVNHHEKDPVTYEIDSYISEAVDEEAQAVCDSFKDVSVFGKTYKGAIYKKVRKHGREY